MCGQPCWFSIVSSSGLSVSGTSSPSGPAGVPEEGGGQRGEEPHEHVERVHDRGAQPVHGAREERAARGDGGGGGGGTHGAAAHHPPGPAVDGEWVEWAE